MVELGHFSLLLALFLSAYAIVADLLGLRPRAQLTAAARNATIAGFLALTVAMAALWTLLLKSDFSVTYVAEHTARDLPVAYKFSSLWAGASGSLLLWLWLQVGLIVWVFCRDRGQPPSFLAGARILANLVSVYFLFVLIFDKHPFDLSMVTPDDGAGLNPLLQHPAMALHPPTLFVGYAAFVIPFLWALVAIVDRSPRAVEFFRQRIAAWILWAWLFLTVGIVLGAWWAYEELGWGGYWAWDPVENSSLLPWLTATALLHCARIYTAGSGIVRWLIFLSLTTFSLCIFGTFLTRYGLVSSVHAFPEPGLGILFLVLLANLWLIAGVLAVVRIRVGPAEAPTRSGLTRWVCRHNWLMLALAFVIFVGTLFPFFSGLLSDQKIQLEPAYFTKITAPGGLLLLLFIGICPYLVRSGLRAGARTIAGGLTAVAAVVAWVVYHRLAVACFIVCGYALANLLADVVARRRSAGPWPLRWVGARMVHLGVVVAFVGIAGSGGYDTEEHKAMLPGDTVEVGSYRVTYDGLEAEHGPNFTAVTANVAIGRDNRPLGRLRPALAFYGASDKRTSSEIDVRRTLGGDLYLALTEVDNATQRINMTILTKPLINWIWIGSMISALGAVLVLAALYGRRSSLTPAAQEDEPSASTEISQVPH